MLLGQSGHRPHVHHAQLGVGGCLQKQQLGVGLQVPLHVLQVLEVSKGHVHPQLAEEVVHEDVAVEKEALGAQQVVPLLQDGVQGRGNGSDAGGRGHRRLAALQGRQLLLQGDEAGVALPGVEIAQLIPGRVHVLHRLKAEGGRLVDGAGQSVGGGIKGMAGVDDLGFKSQMG